MTSCSPPDITDPSIDLPTAVPAYLNCLSTEGSCKDAEAIWISALSTVPLAVGNCPVITGLVGTLPPTPCPTPLSTAFGLMAGAMNKTLPDGIVSALAGEWNIKNLCCAACSAVAAAATTTTQAATTTAQALVVAEYRGSYNIAAPGVSKSKMEEAAKAALATHFDLDLANVGVTVTETRRLSEDVRRLAGSFEITFVLTIPQAKAAAVTTKVQAANASPATFKTDFAAVVITALVEAGVPQSTADGLTVTAFAAAPVYADAATTTVTTTAAEPGQDTTSGAYQSVASMVVMIAIKMLFWGM